MYRSSKKLNNNLILEGGKFAKLMRTIMGNVLNIKTFSIITAENPQGIKTMKSINKELNDQLEKDLKRGNYGFRKIKGKYGNIENPFFVNNISLKDAIKLGKKYNQESIIFGEKIKDNQVNIHYIEGGKIISTKHVFRSLDNPDDYYSEYHGRRFNIPFFEQDIIINRNLKDIVKIDERIEPIVLEIKKYEKILFDENMTEKRKWECRGIINMKFREINNIIRENWGF